MDETAAVRRPSVMKRLLQSVQDEVRVGRSASSPADNTAGVGVDDEGDIDEAGPGRHIREVRQPQPVRGRRPELAVHMIQRTGSGLVADRRAHGLAADCSPKADISHQPGDRAAGDVEAFPPQLPPDLAHAINTEILFKHTPDLDLQIRVAANPAGQPGGIGAPGDIDMIG
jgi:hypothetical protein